MSTAQTEAWTTKRLLAWMAEAFTKDGLDAPRLSAELLLAHVIGCDRLRLYMEAERAATPEELVSLRDLVRRAKQHEPIQYLVGTWSFFGLEIAVDPRVLIPRPCTELLVETALDFVKGSTVSSLEPIAIADVCTGSGCIAAAIAKNTPPHVAVVATDLSPDALAVATANIETLGLVDRVALMQGNLLDAIPADMPLNAVISNPPYIPDSEWAASEANGGVGANVKGHEPELALRGGADGLDLIRPLIVQSAERLTSGGLIAIELAASHAHAALALLTPDIWRDAHIKRDYEGHDRVIAAIRV